MSVNRPSATFRSANNAEQTGHNRKARYTPATIRTTTCADGTANPASLDERSSGSGTNGTIAHRQRTATTPFTNKRADDANPHRSGAYRHAATTAPYPTRQPQRHATAALGPTRRYRSNTRTRHENPAH